MKPKEYEILSRAVEEGILYGWSRAHKYTDYPTEAEICDAIETAVLSAICEVFDICETT